VAVATGWTLMTCLLVGSTMRRGFRSRFLYGAGAGATTDCGGGTPEATPPGAPTVYGL